MCFKEDIMIGSDNNNAERIILPSWPNLVKLSDYDIVRIPSVVE